MDEPTGWVVRGLLAGGAVQLLFVEAQAPAAHTRLVHGLGEDAARFGAEVVVATALLGAHVKGDETLTLQIQGDDPPLSAYADLTAEGALRVKVAPPDLRRKEARFRGMLSVVKHFGGREVWRGITEIAGTTMAASLSRHLGNSEQVDAILGMTVRMEEGDVAGAGGWILERLPEDPRHPSITAEAFEARYGALRGEDPGEVFSRLHTGGLSDTDRVQILEQRPLIWRCRCSLSRIEETLISLGPDQLQLLIEEDHGAEVVCHFCRKAWRLDEARLLALKASIAIA